MSKALSARPGDILTKIAVRVVFDPYFPEILIPEFLAPLQRRSRQEVPTFRVQKPLPGAAEYAARRTTRFTTSIADLVSAAADEVDSLGTELRDWHSNLPEGINSSDKAADIESAAETLESLSFPDVPEAASDLSLVHLPALERDSRPKRRDETVNQLTAVIDRVNEHIEELRQAQDETSEDDTVDTLETFVSELEQIRDELDGVSFPSMM